MAKINTVDDYIKKNSHFGDALVLLRNIITSTELEETIKWSAPVYTLEGKNVIGLAAFKNHFGIWFFNGVFLKDKHKVLVNAQEKTKALRQMRFNAIEDIDKKLVLDYVKEAIENQRSGKEIKPKRYTKAVIVPDVLKTALESNTELKANFKALTPGKQREYCNYISEAKREATKHSRIEKITPLILKGVGLHDKYKNC